MSFHWGWFLRYKLSQPQSIATHPGPAAVPPPSPSFPPGRALAPSLVPPAPPPPSTQQFARRPLRDIQHTHYHPQIVVRVVVSRCATGCREPHTYSADASPSSLLTRTRPPTSRTPSPPPLPRRPTSSSPPARDLRLTRTPATGHLLPGRSQGPASRRTWTKLSPAALAKLELRSSFRGPIDV